MKTEDKIQALADLIQTQQRERMKEDGFTYDFSRNTQTKVVPGKKYTKINVGDSGKYMVVNETGEIFGIKAYGVIHRGHQYGTLDTINQYNWGGYTALKIQVTA
jgi:dsDNA-specific endonuclease/ATPase MutS2